MRIRTANEDDIAIITDIGYNAFSKEEYYSALIATIGGADKLSEIFRKSADICVRHGIALVAQEDGKPVGFVLAFDYYSLKECNPDEYLHFFSHGNKRLDTKLKDARLRIEEAMGAGRDYIYLLSIGVDENYRGRGIATDLISAVINAYSHYGAVTDSSSDISKAICRKLGFVAAGKADGVEILIKKAADLPYGEYPDDVIYVAMPQNEDNYTYVCDTIIQGVNCDAGAFCIDIGNSASAIIVSMSYNGLLNYQRYINPINHAEKKGAVGDVEFIYYVHEDTLKSKRIENTGKEEWSLCADIITSVPVICEGNKKYLSESLKEKNPFYINRFIAALDFRSEYESGIPLDDMGFENYKKRIKRYGLERISIQLKKEHDFDFSNGKAGDANLGNPVEVGLMLSVDTASDIGVLSVLQLSSVLLITQYLDCVSRNQLTVVTENGEVNLYTYLREKYGIKKIGEAKSFVTSFTQKSQINQEILASMMFCETYYEEKEGLGKVVDEDIISTVTKNGSLAQYDYADVYIGTHILLQCLNGYRGCLDDRVMSESVTLFYVELVCFEEAAIAYANQNIITYLAVIESKSPNSTLLKYYKILIEYAKTVDFWDVQMNYASSKKSVNNIRKGFGIDGLLNRYNRNQQILRQVYESRRDYIDRIESGLLTALGAIITVISIVDMLISPGKWVMLSAAAGIIGALLILKAFIFKRGPGKGKKK